MPLRLIALFFFFTCVFTASAMDSDNPIDAAIEFGNVAAMKSTDESSSKNARSLADVSNSQSLADLDASNVAEGSIESSHPVYLNEASVQAQLLNSVTTPSQAFDRTDDSFDVVALASPSNASQAQLLHSVTTPSQAFETQDSVDTAASPGDALETQSLHSVTTQSQLLERADDSFDVVALASPSDASQFHPSVIHVDKAVEVVVVFASTVDASASIVDASEMSIVEFERSSEALGYLSACQPTLVDKLYKRYLLKRKAAVAVAAAKEAVAAAVAAAAAAVAAAFAAVAAAAAASEEADKALAYVRSRDGDGGGDRQN